MEQKNIIAIYNHQQQISLDDFAAFMARTTDYMNAQAQKDNKYKDCDGKLLEGEVLKAMHANCQETPFKAEDICLVSGQSFPDIIAGKHFGVEVKTTKSNKWISTGSSIIESTRQEGVEHIYMMFGKLGGEVAEFRCKPYQDCLCEIAVTHSPRYLIDMTIERDQTIFAKMDTDYDTFRQLDNQIDVARRYYVDKANREGRAEMPWWLSQETTVPATLKMWVQGTFTNDEQLNYRALLLMLFPKDICNSKYQQPALWLCSRLGVLKSNIRDLFTAGGKVEIGGKKYPRSVHWIIKLAPRVRMLVKDKEWHIDIKTYNPELFVDDNPYKKWVSQIADFVDKDIIALIE